MATNTNKTPLWILGKSGTYAILILGLVATLLPFFYISVSSFKNEAELRKTPPTFLMLASDDQSVNPKNSVMFYTALVDNKVSASLHIFPQGGHSIPLKNGLGSSASWTMVCELWMTEIGMLSAANK